MNPTTDIPSLLKKRRAEAGMSQKEVATRCGIGSVSTYGSYEEGRATPDIFLLMRIARTFGYNSIDKFLDDGANGKVNLPIVKAYHNASEEERKIVDRILNIQ